MTSRAIVITGGNSGIGKAMAKDLAERGHRIAIVCRSESKGREACDELCKHGDVSLFVADLGHGDAIADVAERLMARFPVIDSLINNAGVHLHMRGETAGGLEMMFMVNHVAPYLLTGHLLGALSKAKDPRVVTVSSGAHRMAWVDWEDLQCTRRFFSTIQYGNTKLYNIWFTRELQRRFGSQLTASCFHPGAVNTGFAQDDPGFLNVLMRVGKPFLRSPERAAMTGVYLASDAEARDANGQFYINEKPRRPSRNARSDELALRLWTETERLTGFRYS